MWRTDSVTTTAMPSLTTIIEVAPTPELFGMFLIPSRSFSNKVGNLSSGNHTRKISVDAQVPDCVTFCSECNFSNSENSFIETFFLSNTEKYNGSKLHPTLTLTHSLAIHMNKLNFLCLVPELHWHGTRGNSVLNPKIYRWCDPSGRGSFGSSQILS